MLAGPWRSLASIVDAQRLFVENLSAIDRIVRAVVQRHRLPRDDRDDFSSHVRLRLIEDDYRILRTFEGRSSLPTFLTVVITRLFLDYQNQQWGRWRPSAVAVRLGPDAVALDQLVTRDGHPIHEAVQILRDRPGVALTERELLAIWERLPRRHRLPEGLEGAAEETPRIEARAGAPVDAVDEAEQAERLATELTRLFAGLPATDQVIIHLHFGHGIPLASLAERLGRSKSSVQRRVARLLGAWRDRLVAAGLDEDAIRVASSTGHPALLGLLETWGESAGRDGRLEKQDED
jgi:RNA polymerase sigma factor for flagellar operon FliA